MQGLYIYIHRSVAVAATIERCIQKRIHIERLASFNHQHRLGEQHVNRCIPRGGRMPVRRAPPAAATDPTSHAHTHTHTLRPPRPSARTHARARTFQPMAFRQRMSTGRNSPACLPVGARTRACPCPPATCPPAPTSHRGVSIFGAAAHPSTRALHEHFSLSHRNSGGWMTSVRTRARTPLQPPPPLTFSGFQARAHARSFGHRGTRVWTYRPLAVVTGPGRCRANGVYRGDALVVGRW